MNYKLILHLLQKKHILTVLTYVILGDPLNNVDNKLIVVDMLDDVLTSVAPGDEDVLFTELGNVTLLSFTNNLFTRPWAANGAGSIPRRVNLSASEAKHLKAPSDT